MKNPFEYGGIVGASSFCNRKKELADLKRVFENGERLFLYSERRLGKTSLVKLALSQLRKVDYLTAYVDLWSTSSEQELALRLAGAIANAKTSTAQIMLDLTKRLFGSLKPAVTFDDEGKPQVVFGVNKENIDWPVLDDVLSTLPKVAKQTGKKLVVVLDEFQQIMEYGSDAVEKKLRSAIQLHNGISYVFLGSKKHLLQKMFLDKQRPLYRSAGHYPLSMISESEWEPFISKKFEETNKKISETVIERLCAFTQGHPFYTQHLCHALWEITETNSAAPSTGLDQALEMLLQRETFAFTMLWDSLASSQKTLLIAIATSQRAFSPFSSEFVRQSGMRSASTVQRAAEALLTKDLIDRDIQGTFYIPDQFLKLWIQKRMIAPAQYYGVSYYR